MSLIITPEVSQRSTKDSIARPFYIQTDDESNLVESEAIESAYGLFLAQTSIVGTNHSYEKQSNHSARVTIHWQPGRLRRLIKPPVSESDPRKIKWRFSFRAQSKTLTHSINQRGSVGENGGLELILFQKRVGFSKTNGIVSISGIPVNPPSPTFTAQFHIHDSVVDGDFVKSLGEACGTVAMAPEPGEPLNIGGIVFEEGEVFMASASGGQVESDRWIIDIGLAYATNDAAFSVPGVQGTTLKHGHDVTWAYEELQEHALFNQGTEKIIVPTPTIVFVEQAWEYRDWSDLQLPIVQS